MLLVSWVLMASQLVIIVVLGETGTPGQNGPKNKE
jgi:hypothetical protein